MAVMSAVKEKFADALAGLNDPAQRFQRFIEAINDGMPDAEAANAFLCLDADQYALFLDENEEAAAIIQMFKARVAQDQYRKVTRSDDPKFALRWLEQMRAEDWGPKQKVDLTSNGKELQSGVVIVQLPDNGRDSSTDHNQPAAGSADSVSNDPS